MTADESPPFPDVRFGYTKEHHTKKLHAALEAIKPILDKLNKDIDFDNVEPDSYTKLYMLKLYCEEYMHKCVVMEKEHTSFVGWFGRGDTKETIGLTKRSFV